MSILINGMDMPKSCNKCPFLDYEQGFCFASGVKHESGWYESILCVDEIKDGRHSDCPLVPVPPHGDLIDRGALIGVFRKIIADCQEWSKQNILPDEHIKLNRIKRAEEDFVEAVLHIKNAPTIIPAEEGE